MQWIKDMLSEKPGERPQAHDLFHDIMHASDGAFCGKCCSSEDSTTSGTSSNSTLDDEATVKATIPLVPEKTYEASPKQHSTSKSRQKSTPKIKNDPVESDQHPRKSPLHQRVARNIFSSLPNLSSIRLPVTPWSSSTTNLPNVTKDEPEQDSGAKGPNSQITDYLIASETAVEVGILMMPPPVIEEIFDDDHDPYSFTMPGAFPDFEEPTHPMDHCEQDNLIEVELQCSMETAQSSNFAVVDCQTADDDQVGVKIEEKQRTQLVDEYTPAKLSSGTPCFEDFLFNPGPSGFLTQIAAPPGTYSQAFKELLFSPPPLIKRRRSDETLQITMATIEERMKSLLADSEGHSDDSAWNVALKVPRGQLKLDRVPDVDMRVNIDELKRMKQELDQIFANHSFNNTHENNLGTPHFQTDDISTRSRVPTPPVTVNDATEAFVQETARAFQDGGFLDPTTPAKPPEELAESVQYIVPSFTPPVRPKMNSLRSRIASLRAPPQPPGLTGFNLGTLNDQLPPLERRRAKIERASVYMKKVFDDTASSVATSVMSERTRHSFKMAGLFLPSQDRSCDYLGEYTKSGKAAAVRMLLQAGCNPGRVNSPRPGPIFNVVRGASSRHTKCLRALIDHGANVNVRSRRTDKTPLLEAFEQDCWSGYVTVIYLLLAAGANPNAKDPSGDVPLLKLLGGGTQPLEPHRRKALALLLSSTYKTNVDVTPLGTQNKPIHLAIRRNDAWAVGMLLEKDASVIEAENSEGLTPLLLAATFWRTSAMTSEQLDILDHLLEKKANVNVRMLMNSRTPLHIAVSHGLLHAVSELLAHGADTGLQTGDGKRAIDIAGERRRQHGCQGCADCERIHALLRT